MTNREIDDMEFVASMPPKAIRSLVERGQEAIGLLFLAMQVDREFKMQFPLPFPECLDDREFVEIRVPTDGVKKMLRLAVEIDSFCADCTELSTEEIVDAYHRKEAHEP